MEKKCYQCKKTLDIVNFTDNDKVLSKCNICRAKIVKTTNKCDICGVRACYNYENNKLGVKCFYHKEPEMIDVVHRKCIVCKKKRPTYNTKENSQALYCGTCKEPDMIDVLHKKCIVCKLKIPTYNIKGERLPMYCVNCKHMDMVNVINKNCIICNIKKAFYNKRGNPPLYCSDCKDTDMIDVRNKKCIKCNDKRPCFNKIGEKPLYCFNCKDTDMIDVVHKNCITCNINKAFYNNHNEKKALYCVDCKDIDMIDVRNKKCIKCNDKRPCFNTTGETIALYCVTCKHPDMINVKEKKCKSDKCRKRAYYALPGVIPEYCSTHRLDGMIKNPRKKCVVPNCNEIATHGLIQSEHCENHALTDEYNFAERICPKCGKIDTLNKEGICINFCSNLEKDNAIKKRKKKHEEYVGRLINEHIDTSQILFTWNDQVIDTSCTKQRPDFVFHCGTHVIIVEVDEEQHKSYKSCGNTKEEVFKTEARRMYNIGNVFVGLPVTFIRYNPDNYKDRDGKKATIATSKRHDILVKWLKKCIKNDFAWSSNGQPKLRVKYLFYDGYEESDGSFIEISEKDVL
jgi:hypothetical protein